MSNSTIYPPFGKNTSTHQDGLILVSGILIIAFSLPALAFAAIRYDKPLRWSIATTCIAVGLGISQSIPLFIGQTHGLGTSSTLLSQEQSPNSKDIFASEELYLLALGIHKCWIPVIALYLTESSQKPRFKIACGAVLAIAVLWTIGSMVGIGVNCSTQEMFPPGQSTCPAQFSRWLAICSTDVITDLVGFGLLAWLIVPLQAEVTRKLAIICAFLVKIGCVPFSIAHVVAIHHYTSSSDPGIAIVWVLVWQNAQIGWAAMSAAAPSMLFLRKSYDDTWTETDVPSIFGMGAGSHNGSSGRMGNSGSHGFAMGPIGIRSQDRGVQIRTASVQRAVRGGRQSPCDSDASLIEAGK